MTYFLTWWWAGIIVGVSFIATPAKFLTTSSSLDQLLEIGNATFNSFMYVETVFTAFLITSVLVSNREFLMYKGLLPSLIFILFAQYLFLLPKLDARVEKIIQGITVEPSNLHWIYVLAELSKLVILIVLGALVHQRTKKSQSHAID